MTFDYATFCENLKMLREDAGYTKLQMSIQTDIYYQYYCNIENGNRVPNFKNIIAIANALKVSISQLMNYRPSNDYSALEFSIVNKLKSASDNRDLLLDLYAVLIAIKTSR